MSWTRMPESSLVILDSPRTDLRASPGQFFLATAPTFDPYLPRPLFPFRVLDSFVTSFIAPHEVESWFRTGGYALRGPYGRVFSLPGDARRVLVLAADAIHTAYLTPWVEALVARECEVTVVSASAGGQDEWLPPEVEYRAAENLLDIVTELMDWAEALYCSAPATFYTELQSALWGAHSLPAQILLTDLPLPCGTGLCYVCALKTRRGVMLACTDGPVFDLADWSGGE